jgi:hypothetical protein
VRHLHLQVEGTLRRRAGLVEPDAQHPRRAEVHLFHHRPVHDIHVMRGIRQPAVLADEPHVLRADEERERRLRRR